MTLRVTVNVELDGEEATVTLEYARALADGDRDEAVRDTVDRAALAVMAMYGSPP